MAEEPKKGEEIPEEEKLDEEEIKEKGEDEIRQNIIERYLLDEVEQADLIDQLTEEQIKFKKKLSTAIQQKRKWREAAQKKEEAPKETKKEEIPEEESEVEKMIEKKLEERELQSSNLSDELKKEAKAYAKGKEVSIREVLNSPYIQYLKAEEEKKAKEEEASVSFKQKKQAVRDFSKVSPKDFDLTTEEGQKQYEEYKKWLKG